jgi:hypothetical protein
MNTYRNVVRGLLAGRGAGQLLRRRLLHGWFMLVVAAVLSWAAVSVLAEQQPSTPAGTGTSPRNPMQAPDDTEDKAGSMIGDGDGEMNWRFHYIRNTSGTGDPNNRGQDDDRGWSASFLTLEVREPSVITGFGGIRRRVPNKSREHRIVVAEVKTNVNGLWIDALTDTLPADGMGEQVQIDLGQPMSYGGVFRIRMRVEMREAELRSDGTWAYGDWQADTRLDPEDEDSRIRVAFGCTEISDGSRRPITKARAGNERLGNSSGAPDSEGSTEYTYQGLQPGADFDPVKVAPGEPGRYAAPDLVFAEGASWAMPQGEIRFHATGGASFADNASDLIVLARNAAGQDALLAEEIALGKPAVVNGVITVPVTHRDAEARRRVAVMVRGAEVVVPTLAEGTTLSYAVGGSSTGGSSVRTPPLVRVGSVPSPSPRVIKTCAHMRIRYLGDAGVGSLNARIGRFIHMARPYESGLYGGYIDAIVLGESRAGAFRAGSFEITPVDNFSFIAADDTKLFVVHAADDSDAVDAFENAEISVTSEGALRVELGQRLTLDAPLKLIVLNPLLDLGFAPFTPGDNARVAIAGDALRGGLSRTSILVERHFGNADDNEYLPEDPLIATHLTPLAEVKE